MLILENLLGLKSKQADVTAAFLHANLGEDENIYVDTPLGFKQRSSNGKFEVLCLKKLFMACVKVLMPFGNISTRNLVTAAYLMLFLTPVSLLDKVINICHVDDLIFWARNKKDIVDLVIQLHAEGVELEQEDDVAGFLGVHIQHNLSTGFLNMTKKYQINQVLETLGLNVGNC